MRALRPSGIRTAVVLVLAATACARSPGDGGGGGGGGGAGGAADAGSASAADAPAAIPPPDGASWIVAPITSCQTTGQACSAPRSSSPTLHAAYRKDFYLGAPYQEVGAAPTTGGRFQIATIAQATGQVTGVTIDGIDAEAIYNENPSATPAFEWYQVWPRSVVAGQPIWVAFHSRSALWDARTSATLTVTTTGGVAVTGSFAVSKPVVPITYVTTSEDLALTIIHVQNTSSVPQTLAQLQLDGQEVFVSGVACIPAPTIAPGAEAVWTIPRCAPAVPGDPFTVVATWQAAPESVAVGRVLQPAFPIEAWQTTSECAFPGGDASNAQRLQSAAIDTVYVHANTCSACGCDTRTLLTQTLAAQPGTYALAASNTVLVSPPLANTSAIRGVATGDESDGTIYDSTTGVPNAAIKARYARQVWEQYPDLTTFNGAKTNKNIGTFAGMTDVQGIDLYVAGCAPHITPLGNHPPLRGAYDYLRNARNNHMPLPTWLYSQGLSHVWNRTVLGQLIHSQPDPQEILVQGMSVIAAGGKGLLWFQVSEPEAALVPARWQAISDLNHVTRAVRDLLRRGDPTGMVTTDAGTLAESIRAPEALVVPIINLETMTTVDDVACGSIYTGQPVPHWRLADHSSSVRVTIPDDLGVVDVFEVTPAGVVNAPSYSVQGRELVFAAVPLSNANAARLLVVTRDPGLRTRVAATLAD